MGIAHQPTSRVRLLLFGFALAAGTIVALGWDSDARAAEARPAAGSPSEDPAPVRKLLVAVTDQVKAVTDAVDDATAPIPIVKSPVDEVTDVADDVVNGVVGEVVEVVAPAAPSNPKPSPGRTVEPPRQADGIPAPAPTNRTPPARTPAASKPAATDTPPAADAAPRHHPASDYSRHPAPHPRTDPTPATVVAADTDPAGGADNWLGPHNDDASTTTSAPASDATTIDRWAPHNLPNRLLRGGDQHHDGRYHPPATPSG
ncbi:hypothetical protein [Micromonospora sp. WMMD737]|uniref:hypothetical protein n=1 Tax=Micromonospora sp. WMMD737 TaxID=3404113 RepID=UPI003B946A21